MTKRSGIYEAVIMFAELLGPTLQLSVDVNTVLSLGCFTPMGSTDRPV